MRRFLFIFLVPFFLQADWDEFFAGNENPSMFHHVNVITGNLNLSFQDAVANGAVSIPVFRTYSSSAALESDNQQLLSSAYRQGWMFQRGWEDTCKVH
jgi:hypothetical protein